MEHQNTPSNPPTLRGVLQIVRFNWPTYLAGVLVITLCTVGLVTMDSRPRVLLAIVLAAVTWWFGASLYASHLVYDLSPLTRWEWIQELLPASPGRAVNLHAGLDETSHALRRLFHQTEWRTWDFYDVQWTTERSIARARHTSSDLIAERISFKRLPAADHALDAAFLIFCAHELRIAAAREALFHELHRVLRPGGALLIVEHLRDVANFLAYGPGFLHFLPRSEWLRLAHIADLEVSSETRITPFVRVFVLRKPL